MSTHAVKIIEIGEIKPHENAERLEIVPIGGWQAVVKKGDFKRGDRAVYIEPDYVVPTARPEFSFLAKDGKDAHRLKAVRLRGALSFGLLIHLPSDLSSRAVGDNVMDDLGIVRWVPPVRPFRGGSDDHELPQDQAPKVFAPKFDLENIINFMDIVTDGEPVVVTEKIDGGNAKFTCVDGTFFMGSRNRWLRPDRDHFQSRSCKAHPEIEAWCRANPGLVLYGEVYGPVQALRYGLREPRFAAFAALMHDGSWMDQADLRVSLHVHGTPIAPLLYEGPFDLSIIRDLAEQDSRIGPKGHMMEGVVIVPAKERRHEEIGRVALKYISNRYWTS